MFCCRNEQASEQDLCASCGFLEQQDTAVEQPITPQMLMIVSSWLAEVAFEFSMQQETLFLAVGLLSRFLDSSTVSCHGVKLETCARHPQPWQQHTAQAAPTAGIIALYLSTWQVSSKAHAACRPSTCTTMLPSEPMGPPLIKHNRQRLSAMSVQTCAGCSEGCTATGCSCVYDAGRQAG